MQRVCFILKIKKGCVQKYLKAHRVWPEMRSAIRKAGITNYSLFINKEGLAVGYFEAKNPKGALRKLGETEVNRRWQEYMSPYFEAGSGDLQKGAPEWLKQYFYLK